MLRSAANKVMWVGRATVFLVGIAVILALLFAVASTALAGTGIGATFNLGVKNTVNAVTQLVSTSGAGPAGPMLRIDNNSSAVGATGLEILTEAGKPPMKVNRSARVANLNADKLDGLDASAFDTSNTGKIHRIDSATRLDGGQISLLRVGPFEFRGDCNSTPRITTVVLIGAAGRPSSGAFLGTEELADSWGKSNGGSVQLMSSDGSEASATVTGYIYSPGNNPGTVEKGVTFHLYQNRNTHPTVGELCTFGGYVVEDA